MSKSKSVFLLTLLFVVSCAPSGIEGRTREYSSALTTVLGGDTTAYSSTDYTPAGMSEAWRYTFAASGQANSLSFCIAGSNTSSRVLVGLYASNGNGTAPTTRLTFGTIDAPAPGWNTVSVPAANVTAGTKYWLAVLSPVGKGTVTYCAASGTSQYGARATNASNLSTLPTSFPSNATTYLHWTAGIYAANVTNDGAGGATGAGGAASGGGPGAGGSPGAGGAAAGGSPGAGGDVSGGSPGAGGDVSGGAPGSGGAPASGGAPSGGAPSFGAHTLVEQSIFATNTTTLTTPAITTQSSGSSLVVAVGRGVASNVTSANLWDSKGNSPFVERAKLNYFDYPDAAAALYTFLGATGGSGHTFTAGNTFGDETTIVAVEIRGGLTVVDMKSAQMGSGNLTPPSVTTTGPATLVAFCFGGGGNGWSSVSANNGFTTLDSWGASDGVSVQAASAARDVSAAGTYTLTWTTNPPQSAILFLVALQ